MTKKILDYYSQPAKMTSVGKYADIVKNCQAT
jgi:hypothetical protein